MQAKAITLLLVMVTTNTYLVEGQLEKLCAGIENVDTGSSATLECDEKGFRVEISLAWITPRDIKGIRIDLLCDNDIIITVQDFYQLSSKRETFTSSFDTNSGSISSCVLKVCYLTTPQLQGRRYRIEPFSLPMCILPQHYSSPANNIIKSHTSANGLKSVPVTTNSILLSSDAESAVLKPLQTISSGLKSAPPLTLPSVRSSSSILSSDSADSTVVKPVQTVGLNSAPSLTLSPVMSSRSSILSSGSVEPAVLKPLQTVGLKSAPPLTLSMVMSSSSSILSSGSAESAVIKPLQMVSSISSYVLPSSMMSTSADITNSAAAFPPSFFDSINYIVPRQSPIAANDATLSSDYLSPSLHIITTQTREPQTTIITTLLASIPSAYPTFLPDKSTDNVIIPSTSQITMNRSEMNTPSSKMNTQASNDALNLTTTVAGDNQIMLITVLVTVIIFIMVIFMALVSCSVHLLMKHYKIVHKKGNNNMENVEEFTFHIEKDEKDFLSALACSPSLVTIVSPLNEIESPHHCSENSLTTDTGTNDDSDSSNAIPIPHCASAFSTADDNTKLEHEELCSQPSSFSETTKSVCEPETCDTPQPPPTSRDDDTCDEMFHPNTKQLMIAAGLCRMAIDAEEIGTYAKLKSYHDSKAYLHCYNSFVDDTSTSTI